MQNATIKSTFLYSMYDFSLTSKRMSPQFRVLNHTTCFDFVAIIFHMIVLDRRDRSLKVEVISEHSTMVRKVVGSPTAGSYQ